MESSATTIWPKSVTRNQCGSRKRFMRFLLDACPDTIGDEHWWRLATGGWTTPKVPTLYGEFREQFGRLSRLSLDQGFVTHLPEFMSLADDKPSAVEGDYRHVRELMRRELGHKIVWRGMMLTDDELKSIEKNGIASPLMMKVAEEENLEPMLNQRLLTSRPSRVIENHFHGDKTWSPYVSVTEHRDVAVALGRCFGIKYGEPRKLYLFKLRIPELDLIYYTEHGIDTPSRLREIIEGRQQAQMDYTISITVDDIATEHVWDREVESFVFWRVDTEEILAVTRPDVSVSSWNNKFTTGKL